MIGLLDSQRSYFSSVESFASTGLIVVIDESTCMVDVARYFLAFIQSESCGKCTFCRIGTKRMLEILTRITEGKGEEKDIAELEDLAAKVKVSSLLRAGPDGPQSRAHDAAVFPRRVRRPYQEQAVRREEVQGAHPLHGERGSLHRLHALRPVCPTKAAHGERKKAHVIDQDTCIQCGLCFEACRFDAIEIASGREEVHGR